MMPDLGQRLTAALDEMQSLGASDVERYLRALRATDPELAGRLCALLNLPRSNSAGPTALGAERGPSSVVPLPDPDVRGPIPLGEPTASVNAPATASFPPPGHEGRGPAGRGTILNRHQLLEVVGRGAFGEVWKAFDPVLQKHVAVKVSRPDRPTPVAAFLDEARKVALLPRHPAIVQVYDVGASPDGWYIVSEFIDGESLRDRAAAGRLPFEQAARVVATVAGALHAAHLAGLVHRDVKPGNILLDRTGNAYLTDFGLAVREEDQSAERSKVSGTLAYMPPEQISGDTHLLDGRADVYALGAVLYELLTGRMVFRAADVDEYREQILRREPRPPRAIDAAVPEELERVCLKCLAKEVKDRYRTARDVAIELEA
ncbi:MAG: serine/threonine protein kinase, partial [Planctomycetes bacterium]|nr:serine/threonine protein kinase [Planctomycetota bacterium]